MFDIYNGCNNIKGCIGVPENCIANKNCLLLSTFFGNTNESYTFEIFGSLQKGNAYIATALSFDSKMGNDSVMACILNTTSNTVADIKMYWNTPEQNSLPLQVRTFYI